MDRDDPARSTGPATWPPEGIQPREALAPGESPPAGPSLRLRWAAAEPTLLVARLRDRLGFRVLGPAADSPAWLLAFPSALVWIVPLTPLDDRPLAWLAREPGSRPETRRTDARREPGPREHSHPNGVLDLLAVGWATVDRERAGASLGSADPGAVELAEDRLLGARALGVGRTVLLEPAREGRLAASLARWGEGPAALYFSAGSGGLGSLARSLGEGGEPVRRSSRGPFGPSLLLAGGPPAGPHLVVCAGSSRPTRAAGTIRA